MPRLAVTLLVALLLALAGCVHGDDEAGETTPPPAETQAAAPEGEPGEFLQSVIERYFGGRVDAVWKLLHEAHQRAASREAFERCARGALRLAELERVAVDDVSDEELEVDGKTLPGSIVVSQITLAPRRGGDRVVTDTRRVVAVNGEWRWLLNAPELAAYEGGGCPRLPLGSTQ
ncbi:MAG: hypothetical protein ICV64_00090 [Thermoleophilia bacterium]|nr:hypothetical protein [Thermoleophilia bacterium]